jgi:lysophospholipase L1-like esterase
MMSDPSGNSRRNFVKQVSVGVLASLAIPQLVSAGKMAVDTKMRLEKDDIILFQGDSITDWGRNPKETKASTSGMLGNSYPLIAAAGILSTYPDKNLHVYNKGVSGNKVYQLADRWDDDFLALKPTVISILVGVNDLFHAIRNGYAGTIETYRTDYKKLLDRTKQALPDVKLIIGEPFLTKGIRPESENWYPRFAAFQAAAREMADTCSAAFIPYQQIFDNALDTAPAKYWSLDGIHSSVAGAGLMAKAWLEAVTG